MVQMPLVDTHSGVPQGIVANRNLAARNVVVPAFAGADAGLVGALALMLSAN